MWSLHPCVPWPPWNSGHHQSQETYSFHWKMLVKDTRITYRRAAVDVGSSHRAQNSHEATKVVVAAVRASGDRSFKYEIHYNKRKSIYYDYRRQNIQVPLGSLCPPKGGRRRSNVFNKVVLHFRVPNEFRSDASTEFTASSVIHTLYKWKKARIIRHGSANIPRGQGTAEKTQTWLIQYGILSKLCKAWPNRTGFPRNTE